MSARVAEPTRDYSNRRTPRRALSAASLAGAALLVAADLATLIEVRSGGVVHERLSGHAQHDWAVALLGLAALGVTLVLALRGTRVALTALAAIGVAVVLIALVGDLPDARATGVLGPAYTEAAARPGPGFFLEVAGGLLLLVTGGMGLMLEAPGTRKTDQPVPGSSRERP